MSTTMMSSNEEEIDELKKRLSLNRNALDGLRLFALQRPEYVDLVALWKDFYERK
jgi:hypothetical protein